MNPVPSTLNIAGQSITVKVTPMDDSFGFYDEVTRTITLDSSLLTDEPRLREILVHEIVHCALALSGLAPNVLSGKAEEAVATCVSSLALPAILGLDLTS